MRKERIRRFYINDEECSLIVSTPKKECWICDVFCNNFFRDKNGLYLKESILGDFEEHLEQIIGREIIYNTII